MTYNVSNGTLNPTIPYHICHCLFEAEKPQKYKKQTEGSTETYQ